MRKLRCVLFLSVLAVSIFASLGFIKPVSAAYPWGRHEITFNWYQSYIYDDHDSGLAGVGEWYFTSYSYDLDEFKDEWGGEYERDGPGWVDHADHVWNFVMQEGSDTNFELAAWDEDLPGTDWDSWAIVLPTIPANWGNTIIPRRWYEDNERDVDTRFYWKYYIFNSRPTADALSTKYVTEGDPVSFTAPTVTDPEGDSLYYAWDFGDHTTSTLKNPTHTYTKEGKYTVSFKAKDYFGEWSDPQTAYIYVSPVFSATLDEETYEIRTCSDCYPVEDFSYNVAQKRISFKITFLGQMVDGGSRYEGWIEVTIPKSFLSGPWTPLIGGEAPESWTVTETATDTTLYMTYLGGIPFAFIPWSTETVKITGTWIVPEFPAAILMPLLMIATLAAVVLGKKALSTRPKERVRNSIPKVS